MRNQRGKTTEVRDIIIITERRRGEEHHGLCLLLTNHRQTTCIHMHTYRHIRAAVKRD